MSLCINLFGFMGAQAILLGLTLDALKSIDYSNIRGLDFGFGFVFPFLLILLYSFRRQAINLEAIDGKS